MDVEYGGEVGPVARKLSSFPQLQGWVFGTWNEALPDVHNLVHLLAKARLRKEEELQEWGAVARRRRVSKEAAITALTGQVRRQPRLVSARAQARLLLDRGAEAAAGRRRWVEEEERRMSREQWAHVLAGPRSAWETFSLINFQGSESETTSLDANLKCTLCRLLFLK